MVNQRDDSTEVFERLLTEQGSAHYVLRLYITGMTPRSTAAIERVKAICEEYMLDRYELEVIDIYQHPTLAKGDQIVATPTLVKRLPKPLRSMVGDLSNVEKVLMGLDLRRRE